MYISHFVVQQKLMQHCRSTILQFKKAEKTKRMFAYFQKLSKTALLMNIGRRKSHILMAFPS